MRRYLLLYAGLGLALLLSGCASSATHVGRAAEPVAPEKVTFRMYSFPNGLSLIVKNTGENSLTSVQVWVTGGSASDPPDKPGLAHLLEHMLLTGSEHLPPGRAEFYVESLGGSIFGNTGRDFSSIGVTVPPGQAWERAEDILFDLVAAPSFRPEEFGKQRGVVELEISHRAREADKMLMDNLFAQAYQTHPYRHPVTGGVEDVRNIALQDVADYYARTFVPSNMVVVVAGDVKPLAVKGVVEKTFGQLDAPRPKQPSAPQEPYQLYRRSSKEPMPVKLTYLAVGWHVSSASDQDIYPMEVLSAALGRGRGSRLYLELRERKGIAYDVTADLMALRDPGMFVVTAGLTDGENIKQVTDEVMRQLNRIKDDPISDQELARAIGYIESRQQIADETAEGQAYSLGYWATVYGYKDPALYVQSIKKVTAQDVRRVAQKYLGEGNYTISIVQPGETGGQGE